VGFGKASWRRGKETRTLGGAETAVPVLGFGAALAALCRLWAWAWRVLRALRLEGRGPLAATAARSRRTVLGETPV